MRKILLLIFMVSFHAQSQEVFRTFDSLIAVAEQTEDYETSGRISRAYAQYNRTKRNYSRAYTYGKKALSYFDLFKVDPEAYSKILFETGKLASLDADFVTAVQMYERSIEKNPTDAIKARTYVELGGVYLSTEDYGKALDYLGKAIDLNKKLKNYHDLASSYMYTIGVQIQVLDQEFDSIVAKNSLENLKSLDALRSVHTFSNLKNQVIYLEKAQVYSCLGDAYYDRSLKNYRKALSYAEKTGIRYDIGKIYSDMGFFYIMNRKDSAKFYAKKGLDFVGNEPINGSVAYENYIHALILEGNYEEAIEVSDDMIAMNCRLDSDVHRLRDVDLTRTANRRSLLSVFKKRAFALMQLWNQSKEPHYLIDAQEVIGLYDELVTKMNSDYSFESSKLFWRREASQAYLYGAYIAHLLKNPSLAFSYMEKNKTLLLSEGVLKNTEFANLPVSVSTQETRFQKQILELENKVSKDASNLILQDSLFNAKRRHQKFVDSLKKVYPKYFARKIDVHQVSLFDVQEELEEEDAILSYIWSDFDRDSELIVGLLVTKDKAQTFEIRNTTALQEKLKTYRKLISKPFTKKELRKSFQKVGYQLYDSLLPSSELKEAIQGKNLTIIPDGDLQNIPFESLLMHPDSNEYLILNGDINYAYSYSFLKHNALVNRASEKEFIGYSPSNFDSLSLLQLTNTNAEVTNIGKTLDGTVKLEAAATKEDFLKNSQHSKIIHLATHADIGENPWIAFADKKLELHELYTYKNNADLVTLSACNTSLGALVKGEGVLSLARGFFYSGSRSVVSSLWKVNDKSTSEIMTTFYKNVKQGQTKSEAINNAKRAYITKYPLSGESPYYWSSFILIGDAGAIDLSSDLFEYKFFGIVAILLLLAVSFRIKKKARN